MRLVWDSEDRNATLVNVAGNVNANAAAADILKILHASSIDGELLRYLRFRCALLASVTKAAEGDVHLARGQALPIELWTYRIVNDTVTVNK